MLSSFACTPLVRPMQWESVVCEQIPLATEHVYEHAASFDTRALAAHCSRSQRHFHSLPVCQSSINFIIGYECVSSAHGTRDFVLVQLVYGRTLGLGQGTMMVPVWYCNRIHDYIYEYRDIEVHNNKWHLIISVGTEMVIYAVTCAPRLLAYGRQTSRR